MLKIVLETRAAAQCHYFVLALHNKIIIWYMLPGHSLADSTSSQI